MKTVPEQSCVTTVPEQPCMMTVPEQPCMMTVPEQSGGNAHLGITKHNVLVGKPYSVSTDWRKL